MNNFKKGDKVRRVGDSRRGIATGQVYEVARTVPGGQVELVNHYGHYFDPYKFALVTSPSWSEVMPRDAVEFEVQGDTIEVKAQGDDTQVTVLGFKTTEVDGVWDLLSIKKRNPPVPVHLGAKVEYRDKIWMLLYASMVITDHQGFSDQNMIWVEINENQFNWVGHKDIDREKFEVTFTGWQNL